MSNGHQWVNSGWGHHVCERCGLDTYQAAGTGLCRGHRVYACPCQDNAHTHGECFEVFETRRQASDHWLDVHHADLVARDIIVPVR
jgi:hypothetical protein